MKKELVHKTFGCTRFVYNYFLSRCKENGYKKASDMYKELKELIIEYLFLKEVDIQYLKIKYKKTKK